MLRRCKGDLKGGDRTGENDGVYLGVSQSGKGQIGVLIGMGCTLGGINAGKSGHNIPPIFLLPVVQYHINPYLHHFNLT